MRSEFLEAVREAADILTGKRAPARSHTREALPDSLLRVMQGGKAE